MERRPAQCQATLRCVTAATAAASAMSAAAGEKVEGRAGPAMPLTDAERSGVERPGIERAGPGDVLVSVVIPVRDRAGLIGDALDSVAAQTHRPLEIIVADDGSADATAAVVAAWSARPRAHPVPLRFIARGAGDRHGANAARNRGIAAARGAFVAFLDSDDCFHPEKLARQLARLAETTDTAGPACPADTAGPAGDAAPAGPTGSAGDAAPAGPTGSAGLASRSGHPGVFGSAAAVYCGLVEVDIAAGTRRTPVRAFPQGRLFATLLVRDVTAPTSTFLVRRSAFAAVGGFDETLAARQDWEMWLRLSRQHEIVAVPEALVDFRAHGGPRTATNRQREIAAYRAIRTTYAADIAALPFPARAAARSAYFRRMSRVNHHGGLSRGKAFGYALAALATAPWAFDNHAAFAGLLMPHGLRTVLRRRWNATFGATRLAIRSH